MSPSRINVLCFLGWINLKHTAISKKVVGKNVHATIPKSNMGYDQYTVPDGCSCRNYFCCFPLTRANIRPGLPCHFFKFLWRKVHSKSPTIPFGIVACIFSDNLSRNSCMRMAISLASREFLLFLSRKAMKDFNGHASMLKINRLIRDKFECPGYR